MPEFVIEQYELHACLVRVTADTPGEAIAKWQDGEGQRNEDDCTDYLEPAELYGQLIHPDILQELRRAKPEAEPFIKAFRRISRADPEGQPSSVDLCPAKPAGRPADTGAT